MHRYHRIFKADILKKMQALAGIYGAFIGFSLGLEANFLSLAAFDVALEGAQKSAGAAFTLTSPDIAEGRSLALAQVYTGCGGQNISPELRWYHAPKETKSFVITAYDPDAPTGSGWWHWVVYNIPATIDGLARGAGHIENEAGGERNSPPENGQPENRPNLPKTARQARTDYGFTGFGGACPPEGAVHRYQFTVYAVSLPKLDVPENASPALIGFLTKANSLASAQITAVYTR